MAETQFELFPLPVLRPKPHAHSAWVSFGRSAYLPSSFAASLPRLQHTPQRLVRRPMSLTKTEQCIVSGDSFPTDQMIRFAVNPQGVVVPDLTQKLPVEGMWVKADRTTLEKAIRRNRFAWAARENVTIPRDLITQVEMGLSRMCLEAISMSKRAGEIFIGADGVEDSIRNNIASLYIVASDAAENGRKKIEYITEAKGIPVIDFWPRSDLGRAVGIDDVVHISIQRGGLCTRINFLHGLLKNLSS